MTCTQHGHSSRDEYTTTTTTTTKATSKERLPIDTGIFRSKGERRPSLLEPQVTITKETVEEVSWCIMGVDNPIRSRLIKLVGWRWFERIVISVIIINCIMLALYNPLDRQCYSKQCQTLQFLEHVVFAFFALEMLVKMTAMGVIGRRAYFSDCWNLFDFIIVVTGVVDLLGITSGSFLTIARLGRLLRPLRAINRVPNIRILVNLLMDTIPMLGNVLILAFLVFSCFGILGVQLFQGKLRTRCYLSDEYFTSDIANRSNSSLPDYFLPAKSVDFVCALPDSSGQRSCGDIPKEYKFKLCQAHYQLYNKYGNKTNTSCLDAHRYYRSCRRDGPNPFYGSVSFDNIAMAFIFIYQVVTLEGWSDLMYLIQDTYSSWAWIYFVILISIGSFFLVNLALVVITMQFSDTKRREVKLMRERKNMVSSQLSLYTDLCSMWSWVSGHLACCSNYFRSIHYIHQHVLVHQQPSLLCDECRRDCSVSDADQRESSIRIPDIEVSNFDDRETTFNVEYCSRRNLCKQKSASFPGISPTSIAFHVCEECFTRNNGKPKQLNTYNDIFSRPDVNHQNPIKRCSILKGDSSNNNNCSTIRRNNMCKSLNMENFIKNDNNKINDSNNDFSKCNQHLVKFRSHSASSNVSNVTTSSSSSNPSSISSNLLTVANTNNNKHFLTPSFGSSSLKVPSPSNNGSRNSLHHSRNTLSVHADTAITVTGARSSSISSRTSLSLRINSLYVDTFEACLDAETKPGKTTPRVQLTTPNHEKAARTSSMAHSIRSARFSTTDSSEYGGSDLGYGSVFDLRHCDKYYVSENPTKLQRFKLFCKQKSESTKASNGIMFIIVINTLCMAIEHHNEPLKVTQVLETLNVIFIWMFTFEMCVKMFGIGIKTYFSMGFNCFDFVVVILSILEVMIDDGNTSGNFTIFRSLRLLRIFRLIRPMRHQIAVMLRTTSSVMTFFALLFLFMFTFAILGMNIFGGKFVFTNRFGITTTSRSNFDSFVWAIVTVFQILTQEDWNLVMYDGIRATNLWASLYFLSLMTIGYYVLFNLLVAILVEGFTTPLEKKRMARHLISMLQNKSMKKTAFMKRTLSLPDMLLTKDKPTKRQTLSASERQKNRRSTLGAINLTSENLARFSSIVNNVRNDSENSSDDENEVSAVDCGREEKPKQNEPVLISARANQQHGNESAIIQWKGLWHQQSKPRLPPKSLYDRVCSWCHSKTPEFTKSRKDWSLFLFPIDSRFRRTMTSITKSKWFDGIILILIIYSCVLLALENPHKEMNQDVRTLIDVSTFIMTGIFFCEMLAKAISDGFVMGEMTYLKNGWNVMDFALVLTSVTDVFMTIYFTGIDKTHHIEIIKGMRVLRATRALRPLRMIRKAPGLKLVVQTLLYSLKPIGNTVLIAAIFFIVFGILGVQQLKGKFYYCAGVDPYSVENKTECIKNGKAKWINYQYNFDNLIEALMTLFVVSTKDGWVDIMRRGIDARGVDLDPRPNHAQWRILYFVSFLMIGGFLVLNMIVGVVVENFQKCQELQEDQNMTRVVLLKWKAHVAESLGNFWQSYPTWRRRIYKMSNHAYWDISVTCVICSNVIIMSLEHYEMSEGFHVALEISNFIFTFLYVIEAIILLVALSPRRYFKNRWYCLDMAIVLVSVIGVIMENLDMQLYNANPAALKAMRLLRVIRALKLLKMAKGLRFLLDHVGETIPQVTNLALLFCLLFFVYSCLGIQLFGTLECSEKFPCAGLGRHANFNTLGSSMLTLFRIATGDNWSGILRDTLRPNCDKSITCKINCCSSRYVAPLFFVSFVLFAQFVLVNIVIAVLMKHLKIPDENKKRNKRKTSETGIARNAVSKWRSNMKDSQTKEDGQDSKNARKGSVESRTRSNRSSTLLKPTNFEKTEKDKHNTWLHMLKHYTSSHNNTNQNSECANDNVVCYRARKKLLRKYSCPDKLRSQSTSTGLLNDFQIRDFSNEKQIDNNTLLMTDVPMDAPQKIQLRTKNHALLPPGEGPKSSLYRKSVINATPQLHLFPDFEKRPGTSPARKIANQRSPLKSSRLKLSTSKKMKEKKKKNNCSNSKKVNDTSNDPSNNNNMVNKNYNNINTKNINTTNTNSITNNRNITNITTNKIYTNNNNNSIDVSNISNSNRNVSNITKYNCSNTMETDVSNQKDMAINKTDHSPSSCLLDILPTSTNETRPPVKWHVSPEQCQTSALSKSSSVDNILTKNDVLPAKDFVTINGLETVERTSLYNSTVNMGQNL